MEKIIINFFLLKNSTFSIKNTAIKRGSAIALWFTYPLKSHKTRQTIALVIPQVGHLIPVSLSMGQVIPVKRDSIIKVDNTKI